MGLGLNIAQKLFVCPYCGAPFSSQADLDAHIASEHPGEVPGIIGLLDWLKANWPWVAAGGIALTAIIAMTRKGAARS
ncbi:MAG: C2H2-type zinc finger protein [Desulfobacterales bacterium]|nr:C2H2-type zinc finger protein [Desulfobacterales bacterium]